MTQENRRIQIKNGFTMIEVVITIAVAAILGAVLIPLISQNISSARVARATADVATIGKAMVQFRQDTGKWPVYVGTTNYPLLFSDADANGDGIPDTSSIPSTWNAIAAANRLSLAYHLVNYHASVQQGPSTNGLPSWNGPYLSEVKPDPWGNAYVVNSQWLYTNTNNVYVLSAGPGRPAGIETPFNQAPPANTDDITFRLQ